MGTILGTLAEWLAYLWLVPPVFAVLALALYGLALLIGWGLDRLLPGKERP